MKIFVTAKPNSKEEKIEMLDKTHFKVSIKEPPVDGRANAAIVDALARHLGIPSSRVRLVAGFSSRQKTFTILP